MKVKKSNSGVSEVVGSILILMITITMFAVVMGWVLSYPTPSGRAYVDLNAEVNGQYVNITHCGGEPLEDKDTDIHVYVDGDTTVYEFSDGGIDTYFSVGETWSKKFDGDPVGEPNVTSTSTVEVAIVDTKGGEVIFDETIQGVSGNNKPVVAFACTVPTSVPADGSTPFKVYAYIMDPDKDVSTVTVNLSSVGEGAYSMTSTDGIIFQKSSLKIYIGTSAGRYMLQINVTDSNSNNATGYVWITVTDPSVLGGGGFATEGSSYGSQGFMITNDFNSTTDIRIFNYTDTIWVKMASNVLTNVEIKNQVTMKDVYGNILTSPTSSNAFVYYKYDSGYYFYVYSFDVQTDIQGFDDTTGGVYPTHIELKDYSGHVFIVDTTIIVKDINGNIPSYGILKTYSNAGCTVESTWFDSEGMMYVKVFTKTVGGADSATVGNIEIRDFIGGAQVKRRPGNEPVSNITIVDGNYSFSINLSNANQDPWLHPGNNTYTLFVRNFTDADESYQNLALQVIIYAPPKMLDIIAGIDEAQDPAWATKDYLYFYENDNYWTRTCLEHDPTTASILDVAVGDMDEDGDLDVVGGAEAKYVYLYDNLKGDGSKWNRTLIDDLTSSSEKPWCVEVGDMDGDSALDIVVGTDSKKVYLYLNDGAWTRSTVSTGEDVYSVALGDFDGDGSLDIAVGRINGKISVYLNRGNGTFRGEPGTPTDYHADAEWITEGNITGSYLNTMASDNVYENLTEGWTTIISPTTKDNATSETTILGTKTNTYTATFVDDGTYEKIKEVTDSSINKIDHRWTITLTGGGESWVFNVEAKRELGAQGDDNFDFYYSKTGSFAGEEVKMLTVTTTLSDFYYNYTFPISLADISTVYIRALDTNRNVSDDAGNEQDTLSIDRMYIATTQPNSTYSSLTHVWRIPSINASEASYSFYVEANHTSNSENDDFTFQYSTTGLVGPWIDMLNVTKTTDDNSIQTYSLPSISGTIYIRVVDTNSTGGYTVNDTLYVDKMFIRSVSAETLSISFTAGGNTINCLAIADLDGDGNNDIAAGDSSGIVWQCINQGSGTSFTVSQVANAGSAVNGIGIGNLVGTSKLDIAVGTSSGKVYVYDNGTGSWTATEVASTGVTIYDLAVGDMESDGDDDIVIATGSGQLIGGVHYYENDGSWTGTSVDNCGTPVFCVAVGDIDG